MPVIVELPLTRSRGQKSLFTFTSAAANRAETFQEETFCNMLTLERRRAERSRKPFILMLLDATVFSATGSADKVMCAMTSVVLKSTRETDLVGWYKDGVILGIIFTEISLESKGLITEILRSKILNALHAELSHEFTSKLSVTVHLFPESGDRIGGEPVADLRLYPDLSERGPKNRPSHLIKRLIDITGSCALFLLLSPLLAAIAVAIKLTSKGSVIFRQERLGQFGVRFKCLKFRTMYTNSDSKIHQKFIQGLFPVRRRSTIRNQENLFTRLRKITASHRSGDSFGRRASMNFRNFGTFWRERCPSWVLALRCHTNSKSTISGTGVEFLKSGRVLRDFGKLAAGVAHPLMTWFDWTSVTLSLGHSGST